MRRRTLVTRAGLPRPSQGTPFLAGPTFAGAYHAAGDPASSAFTYGRFHNPTWTLYEQALSELEGGPVVRSQSPSVGAHREIIVRHEASLSSPDIGVEGLHPGYVALSSLTV